MHYQRPFRSPSSGPSSSTTFPPAPRRRARTKREEFDQGTEETAIAEAKAKATAEVAACSSSYEEHRTARASKQASKQASRASRATLMPKALYNSEDQLLHLPLIPAQVAVGYVVLYWALLLTGYEA
uniref:Uncharacterized protein n=1 Tax=Vespula pensylvanica TaxID=30213 RepID=A0A834PGR8_VESPE|nr:hypothetical protein H0235_001738 [Vespula pensylvanica]